MKVLFIVALLSIALAACSKRDNSDPPEGRSGFEVFTDSLTGCQYIGWGDGAQGKAITPRMNADGKQICGVKP